MSDTDNRYLHLIRQDCPLPPGTHVVGLWTDPANETAGSASLMLRSGSVRSDGPARTPSQTSYVGVPTVSVRINLRLRNS